MVRPLQLSWPGHPPHCQEAEEWHHVMVGITKVTKVQHNEVATEVEKLRESGAAKPCQCSDKDKPHGPRKKKTAAVMLMWTTVTMSPGGNDEDLDSNEPRLPIVSPFIAVQPADRAESPTVLFVIAPSLIPTATTNPTPAKPFATTPLPFATTPSPIPTATTSPTPAAPFTTAPLPIPTLHHCPPTPPPPCSLPFASASASDVFMQNPTPASVLSEAPLFLPLCEDGFTLDFDDMDLTMVPYVTQPNSSTNNFSSANWRLNMSNHDEEWTDALGVNSSMPNAALRASGGTCLNTGLFGGTP
ncbi:hypothetical protein B0H14DRAFT_3651815, partial [Mycena olivaceomarginata]